MKAAILSILITGLFGFNIQAQHSGHTSEYAGEESRRIKSLSESDIQEIKTGNGWGLAKSAELNGYPGPSHVLDMKKELKLSEEQIIQVSKVYETMKMEAIEKGTAFLNAEEELSKAFKDSTIDENLLAELTRSAAIAEGELRRVHLSAHLKMMDILTPHQIMQYNTLRGYTTGNPCDNVPEGHDEELWKKHNNCG